MEGKERKGDVMDGEWTGGQTERQTRNKEVNWDALDMALEKDGGHAGKGSERREVLFWRNMPLYSHGPRPQQPG